MESITHNMVEVSALFKYYMQRHVIKVYSDRQSGVVLFRRFNILQLINILYWALRMCDGRSWYRIPAHKLHFHQLSVPSCCLQQHNTNTVSCSQWFIVQLDNSCQSSQFIKHLCKYMKYIYLRIFCFSVFLRFSFFTLF